MADIQKIADDLSGLTVLEASELTKILEEKWGVSAAAPVAVAAPAAGQAGVERALEKYKSELIRDMKLMGCTKISDLNRNNLRFRG